MPFVQIGPSNQQFAEAQEGELWGGYKLFNLRQDKDKFRPLAKISQEYRWFVPYNRLSESGNNHRDCSLSRQF